MMFQKLYSRVRKKCAKNLSPDRGFAGVFLTNRFWSELKSYLFSRS